MLYRHLHNLSLAKPEEGIHSYIDVLRSLVNNIGAVEKEEDGLDSADT